MKYRTVVADPPWEYPEGFSRSIPTGHSLNVKRDGDKAVVGGFRSRSLPYTGMPLSEIQARPIPTLVEPNARVFLWTTNKWLPEALGAVLPAWGLTYRQLLVWHKADGGPFITSVAPNTAEFLIVATVGTPERTGSFPSQVLKVPAPRKHSTKPEAFLDYIEQVSLGPYLELFARRNRMGWDTWGNESLEHVSL